MKIDGKELASNIVNAMMKKVNSESETMRDTLLETWEVIGKQIVSYFTSHPEGQDVEKLSGFPLAKKNSEGFVPFVDRNGKMDIDGEPRVYYAPSKEFLPLVPLGFVGLWPKTTDLPKGWEACTGSSNPLSATTYPSLFALLGYSVGGSGDSFYPPNWTAPSGGTYIIKAFN